MISSMTIQANCLLPRTVSSIYSIPTFSMQVYLLSPGSLSLTLYKMAFASSRIGGQDAIIKPCDLCENEDSVNWFCKNCFQNLCERCKKMHPKIVSFKDHQLVPMLEGFTITKENVSNLCDDHDEPFSFYCRRCVQNICSKCLSMFHNKHEFIHIHQFQSELQSTLQDVLKEKEIEKEQIKQNWKEFAKHEEDCEKTLMENFATIDERRNAIQFAVAKECDQIKHLMKTTSDQQLRGIKEKMQKLEEILNTYDETIRKIKQQLQLQTAGTLHQFVQTSVVEIHSLKPLSYSIPRSITFKVGIIDKESLCNMIGMYVDKEGVLGLEKRGNVVLQLLKIVSEFELDVKRECKSICNSSDGNIWIGCFGSVYKMNSNCSVILCQKDPPALGLRDYGTPTQSEYRVVYPCRYMACLQSGDAVVSYGSEKFSYIDKFTSDGRRVKFEDFLPMTPYDIAVSNLDEIVVSVRENKYNGAKWFLVILSNKGKQLKKIEVVVEIESFCIDKNIINGNFIISNRESLRLIIIGRNGAVLKEIQTMARGLRRLTCDRFGNVMGILDDGKAVGLISEDGIIERLFTVQCYESIKDISLNREDRLLILVDEKKVIVAKYLQ